MAEMSQAVEASTQANITTDETRLPAGRQVYEVGFHIVPTVAESDIGSVLEKIRAVLATCDAEIIKEVFPSKKTLAYVIERPVGGKREKYTESYFGFIKFAVERESIPTFMAALRGMNDVLRFLIIQTVREEVAVSRRAVFSSDRLEGETIKKPTSAPEAAGEISEEELNKSIDALMSQ